MPNSQNRDAEDPVDDSVTIAYSRNSTVTKMKEEDTVQTESAQNYNTSDLTVEKANGYQEKANDQEELDEPPDGGYGWVVVAGVFLCPISSFGIATSVMQDYFEHSELGATVSNPVLQLSFVGTLALLLGNVMTPFVQVVASYWGNRLVLFIGTLLLSIGLIMAGFSTKIWHLYLTQGICFGLGMAFVYMPIMSVAPQWFSKKRAFAQGIVTSGSGMGGLIMPFIMNAINDKLGPAWTFRILGFIALLLGGTACILVRDRKRNTQRKSLSNIIQFKVLKNRNYDLWVLGCALHLMGNYMPFFFIPAYATWCGLSRSDGASLVAVSSACNTLGRICCGIIADRLGAINTNIIFLIISGLSNLLIWNFVHSYGGIMAFCVVFGFTCGSVFPLLSPITVTILGMDQLSSGLSLLFVLTSFTLFGNNIASAIEDAVSSEPFFTYKMFAGLVYISAAIVMIILKLRINRRFFCKV